MIKKARNSKIDKQEDINQSEQEIRHNRIATLIFHKHIICSDKHTLDDFDFTLLMILISHFEIYTHISEKDQRNWIFPE